MTVNAILFLYVITALIFFVIDLFWLGIVAKKMYRRHLGHLLAEKTNWPAAIIFYSLYIIGLLVFALLPGLKAGSLSYTCLHGALFGFFTYLTYDLTNLATMKKWPVLITVLDTVWGTFIAGASTSLAWLAFTRLY